MFINEVRQSLLEEAKASPNLLSDLAGLENYIAESYHNRSFIELLQNADDAKASRFKIFRNGNFLYIANNGRVFNQKDLESLCRSAASSKERGKTIGYRGIGFKSVVSFAKEIHIISADLEITFSKRRTQLEIPQANRVPLIRIPHILTNEDKVLIQSNIEQLKHQGFSTIFVFTGVTMGEIESEFNSFDYNSLIFLRNINETEINTTEVFKTKIIKTVISESDIKLNFKSEKLESEWYLSIDKDSSIAFSIKEGEINRLSESEALIHAFLPTEDNCGLGILINGNFSTDPSRRHLIYDSDTINAIDLCSKHILKILEKNIQSKNKTSINIVKSLIPYSDPRLAHLKKTSFNKLLLESLKKQESSFFETLILSPVWLNTKDYIAITKSNVDNHFFDIEGFTAFMKYLGAKEASFNQLSLKINNATISTLGCVQICKHISKSILTNNSIPESEIKNLNILLSKNKRVSFNEVNDNDYSLDSTFLSLLLENGLTEFDIKQVFKKLSPKKNIESMFLKKNDKVLNFEVDTKFDTVRDWFIKSKESSYEPIKTGIKRWRSAEEQTLEILNLHGFKLEDVSKQNIGYDLDGYDPNGNEIHIEVKSITLPGQKFKLTNNEIAVAQEKQNAFYVAVVRQTDSFFEIAMIPDPVKNLTLNRQCVQWIWECSDYEYKPRKFQL